MNLQKLALRGVALALLSGLLTSCATTSKESSLSDESDIEQRDDREIVDDIPEDLGEIQVGKRSPEEEEADRLASQTFPIVQNPYVQKWLDFFTVNKRGRRTFEKWMARSTRYIPIIKPILQEHGMPEDLIYLSMIESGFNPRAYSHAHAVGPWQFIRATGKRYGLNVEFWIDERRDIYKSTHAAARYLKDLYTMFGSWYLAAAAYNAGEGKVLRAVKRDQTRDFWKLERNKRNFRAETRNYVPKIIAAAIIAKTL